MYLYVNYICYSLETILKCSKKTNRWKITSQINCNKSYTSLRNIYYFKTFKTATNTICNLQGSQCLTAPVYYFTESAEISEHHDKNKNRLELTTF